MSLSINPINHSYEEVIAKLSKQIEKDDMEKTGLIEEIRELRKITKIMQEKLVKKSISDPHVIKDIALKKQTIQKTAYKINKENEELERANSLLDQEIFDLEKDNTNLEKEKKMFDAHLRSYDDLIYENNMDMEEKNKIIERKNKELEIAIQKLKEKNKIIRDYESKQVSPCDFFKAFGKNFPRFFTVSYSYILNKIFYGKCSTPKQLNIINEINDTTKGIQKIIKLTQTVGRL